MACHDCGADDEGPRGLCDGCRQAWIDRAREDIAENGWSSWSGGDHDGQQTLGDY